jgi:putative DNA primase/helicase
MDKNTEINMGEAASAYAKGGYAIFPVHTIRDNKCTCGQAKSCKPAKHPIGSLVPRGVLDATADQSTIKSWWRQVPDANIGIATGKPSNLVVLDVDGEAGEATLADLEKQHGQLPPTWQVKTGKGRHLYFLYPKDVAKVKSVARAKLGVDVRADGGYVLGAPSLHQSGKRYAVVNNAAIADCPTWVVDYANGTPKGSLPPANAGRFALNAFEGKSPPSIIAADPMKDNLSDGIRTQTAAIPFTAQEEARLRSALAYIPPKERDTWRDVGFALQSLGWGDTGYDIWTDWSGSCPEKYDGTDQIKTWESFDRPYDGPRITVATIFYMAAQRGWRDETQTLDFHTDLGNARHLVARHGQNIRYIPEWNKWIIWRDDRWDIDTDGAIMRLAKETVEARFSEAVQLAPGGERDALLKHAIKSQAEARLKAMVSLAESEASVVVAAKMLDADRWLLGVQNGVIELKTGSFRSNRREDLITKFANVVFDPNAQCPEWLKFLDVVMGGDASLQDYLQRVSGYMLTGMVSEEVMFVLYGTGNNGKSTYRETLHALFGDYALAADAGLLTERKKAGGATEEIARLKGRRFVAVNETAENDHLNEARIKFITSQDTITARNLYGHLFDFFPSHKTSLTTNHEPIVRGTDEGIWRRVQLIPFTVTILKSTVEKDFRDRRLMPELPGILNWALAGLAAYLKQGLDPPQTVLASTQDYRNDMDVVGQWIAERCELDPNATIATREAFADYSLWADEEVGWTLKKLTFRRHLSDRGFGAKKGSGGERMIRGLRLKTWLDTGLSIAAPVIGKLDDGKIIRDDGIFDSTDLPKDGDLDGFIQWNKNPTGPTGDNAPEAGPLQ